MCARGRLAALVLGVIVLPLAARSVSAQAAPAPPIKVGNLTISGYVQIDYLAALEDERSERPTEAASTFTIPRARLGVAGELGPRVTWYLLGDFANVAENRVLRDAYVRIKASEAAAFQVGQFNIPFSLERITSTTKLEVIDRSVIGTAMAPARDFGLLVYNPKPFWGWLSYSASVINGTGQNRLDDNNAKDVVGRLAARVPQVAGLSVGVNVASGEQSVGDRRRLGADVAFERGPIRLAAETLSQTIEGETRRETSGYYVLAVWRRPASKPAPYYAGYELAVRFVDVDDDAFTLTSRTLQFGGNFYVTPQVRVMNNLVVPLDNDQPRPRTRWWSRAQVVF